jgi:hypothetical protein
MVRVTTKQTSVGRRSIWTIQKNTLPRRVSMDTLGT